MDLPFSPPPRSGALLRGELGCARRTHGSEAGYIARVGATRSADTHMHVRWRACARTRGSVVVCGLGPGRDVAGGRPARDARASGRVRALRGRRRAPRRTRNPAPASAARALAPARALALALSAVCACRSSCLGRYSRVIRCAAPARFDRSTPLGSLDSILATLLPGHCTRQWTDLEKAAGFLWGLSQASADRPLRVACRPRRPPTAPVRGGDE